MQLLGQLNQTLIDKPYIYRIELLDRFFQILDNKELVFVRPSCWSDPLENIIFNATLLKAGKVFEHPAKKEIYGQCWSHDDDSYALWQIYTTKADNTGITKRHFGVRLTTHIDRLIQLSMVNKGIFYYGLIDYLPKYKLLTLKNDTAFIKGLKSLTLNQEHFRTLLVKRKSYKYENELRLLCVPDKSCIDTKFENICRLKIEPTKFISSVRFDPALPYSEFKKLKSLLINKYNFEKTRISQSTINSKNKFIFNLD